MDQAVTLIYGHAPDEVYNEVRQHFTEEELTRLTLAIVAINGWNRFGIAIRFRHAATSGLSSGQGVCASRSGSFDSGTGAYTVVPPLFDPFNVLFLHESPVDQPVAPRQAGCLRAVPGRTSRLEPWPVFQ
jgi:hypothetical protein